MGPGAKVELLLRLLRACDLEGEDLSLSDLLNALKGLRSAFGTLVEELSERYGHLPPRVAFSMMRKDPEWCEALEEASRAYLAELLEP